MEIKKVLFGTNVKYEKVNGKIKKKIVSVPKWSEIKKTVPIKKGQTVVMRLGEEFNLMCFDLDTKDPTHPDYKLMAEKIYTENPTSVQETPNGFHFFYKWDKRLAKTMAKITRGDDSKLDIKSNMGLVNIKAPYPYHELYHWWENKTPIAKFTAWEILEPYLTNQYLGKPPTLEDEKKKLQKMVEAYEKNPTPGGKRQIKNLTRRIVDWNKKRKIDFNSPEIERAKQFPIRDLLNSPSEKLIRCISPDHEDKSPSMQITGNFAYCHGCGASFDAIDIRMLQTGESFPEAVKFLNK